MTARPVPIPSRQVLKRLPGRAVTFLHAIGSWPALGARMAEVGFGEDDHAEGMRLLAAACAYGTPSRGGLTDDETAVAAERDIEAWVREHFLRYQLAVRRLHPDAPSPFHGIEDPAEGEALSALDKLLRRLRSSEGPEHEQASAAVLQTLERRGLGPAERLRLEELVCAAQGAPEATEGSWRRDPRYPEMLRLLEWYRDWSTTAKSAHLDRRQLMALGLATRGKRDAGPAEEEGES